MPCEDDVPAFDGSDVLQQRPVVVRLCQEKEKKKKKNGERKKKSKNFVVALTSKRESPHFSFSNVVKKTYFHTSENFIVLASKRESPHFSFQHIVMRVAAAPQRLNEHSTDLLLQAEQLKRLVQPLYYHGRGGVGPYPNRREYHGQPLEHDRLHPDLRRIARRPDRDHTG